MISKFIEFMAEKGYEPANISDIVADGKWNDYQILGDPKGKKKGFYTLSVYGDYISGAVGDRRHGDVYQYNKPTRKLTDEERRAYAKQREEDRKKREQEIADGYEKAAQEAKKLWSAGVHGAHPYLERKQIKGEGTRILDGLLMIPMYAEGKLWGVQTIDADGDKQFQWQGRKKGCYAPITTADEDKSVIYITEGYATGCSVREATNKPVVCAFDAGNLIHVAKELRTKYPDSVIVIAGDNDPEKIHPKTGKQVGCAGQIKGMEAAEEINGIAVFPDEVKTDWNDVHVENGLQFVKNSIEFKINNWNKADDVPDMDVPPEYVTDSVPVHVYEQETVERAAVHDWRQLLITNGEGKIVKGSLKNMMLFMEYHNDFKGVFCLNEFQSEIYVKSCPIWESAADFVPHRLEDNDITHAAAALEKFGVTGGTDMAFKAIRAVAERNKFHPAREYFDRLEWDGVDRLSGWLINYLGAHDDEKDYLAFIGEKWLTAAVKRVYEPACKFDHILVLEGKQGRGKSTALEALSTFGGHAHFTDNIKLSDIQSKDTILLLQGSIIVELAELAGFNKKEDDEIKGWITVKEDRCRVPYGKTITVFKRQFVLGATTNNYEYLKDPTGNRRYWPCKVGIIDIKAIERDREQLWAQAVYNYRNKLYIGPNEKEQKLANDAQVKRLASDVWEDKVSKSVEVMPHDGFKTSDILNDINIPFDRQDAKTSRRVSDILKKLGFDSVVRRKNGKTERLWVRDVENDNNDIIEEIEF